MRQARDHSFGIFPPAFRRAWAECARSMIRERTQVGLAAAKPIGRTAGVHQKLTAKDIEAAKAMLTNPDIGVSQVAHRIEVSTATLDRHIPATRAGARRLARHEALSDGRPGKNG